MRSQFIKRFKSLSTLFIQSFWNQKKCCKIDVFFQTLRQYNLYKKIFLIKNKKLIKKSSNFCEFKNDKQKMMLKCKICKRVTIKI